MADDDTDAIENALNTVVSTVEKSAKMKKELKQSILDTISTLRNLCVNIISNSEEKNTKIRKLEAEVTKGKAVQHRATGKTGNASVAPSVIQGRVPEVRGAHGKTSVIQGEEITGQTALGSLPGTQSQGTPQHREGEGSPAVVTKRSLYSEALTGRVAHNRFKLTVRPKEPTPPESIKGLLKATINHTKIRVAINTLMTQRNGQVLIETSSREELEAKVKGIKENCGDNLESSVHKLRCSRLVILNIPENITVDNVEDTIVGQNTDISLQQGEIQPKFSYQTKQHGRNLVIEVEAGTRKRLMQKQGSK